MKILCIGDSNTFGYDPRSYLGERYPEDIRWTDQLKDHDVINWGINGITIPGDPAVYLGLIRRKEPDLVIVMLGTNDLLQGASAEQTCHRMKEFLDSICTASKSVLLIAPPPFQYGEDVQSDELIEASKKLAKLYSELAERKGCRFADAGEWNIELTFDGVHLSPAGHEAFAKNLEAVLKKQN